MVADEVGISVAPEGLTRLAHQALRDVSFLLRPAHNKQVAGILADPEASPNDRGVALALLRNAEVAARFELPLCQDTGTAIIVAKKGQRVWTGVRDEEYLSSSRKPRPGKPSGSFGPTTAGRMDAYVDLLQSRVASLVMIAKGNRSRQVTEACSKHGGFYFGSIGGAAAILAEENIRKVECIDYPELGMEAVWKIDMVDFPAFILDEPLFAGGHSR